VTLENETEVSSETWLWRTKQKYPLKCDSGQWNRRILWNVTLEIETKVSSGTWPWRTKQKYPLKRDFGERNRSILWNVTMENETEVSSETWLWTTKHTYPLNHDSGYRNKSILWNVTLENETDAYSEKSVYLYQTTLQHYNTTSQHYITIHYEAEYQIYTVNIIKYYELILYSEDGGRVSLEALAPIWSCCVWNFLYSGPSRKSQMLTTAPTKNYLSSRAPRRLLAGILEVWITVSKEHAKVYRAYKDTCNKIGNIRVT